MAERGLSAALQRRHLLAALPAAALAGCAIGRGPQPATPAAGPPADGPGAPGGAPSARAARDIQEAEGWHPVPLPGKAATRYHWEHKGGRRALAAHAERSASMWRRRLQVPSARVGAVAFSWWVDRLIEGASVADAEREDAPVRVLFGFGGERQRLSARNRMLFELAHALTGEEPPFATLMYVWENQAPLDAVIHNPRSDRIRKIVVDSGPTHLGRWRDHRRDLAADFRRAFGEAPGALQSVALMTDADNTRSSARGWYGPVHLG